MHTAPCIWLLHKLRCCPTPFTTSRNRTFKWLVFSLTFVSYVSYHASRKPISVVKNVLNQNCSGFIPPPGVNASVNPHWCDWKPFDQTDSNTLLGFLDSAYLFSYAIFMFVSGMIAERMDLRYFLSIGMVLSGLLTCAFGFAFYWDIHHLWFFLVIQVVGGAVQASGWPGVVTVMGNWYGKAKRGLIMGLWNSHTSVGNIIGSLMASAFVDTSWGLSFIIPGCFIAAVGVVNFLFLTPYPEQVGCEESNSNYGSLDSSYETLDDTSSIVKPPVPASAESSTHEASDDDRRSTCPSQTSSETGDRTTSDPNLVEACQPPAEEPISFFKAMMIPGVLPFATCLFFAKLVSYTFLYWLPRFLHSAADYSPSESANLSTLFDAGGIVGGILAGLLNDWTGAPGIVCVIMLIISIPVMFVYQSVATVNRALNTFMLVIVGLLVNGPYALITTAVSADLGTSLRGNNRALATVTAIIDGTGSVGAALGPLLAGAASSGGDWTGVFVILMCSNAIAVLSLGWVLRQEIGAIRARRLARSAVVSDGAT